MIYIKQISSLKEMSSIKVAINLCQDNGFKEIVLRLEKPTYGFHTRYGLHDDIFITDPEKLSVLVDIMNKSDDSLLDAFMYFCYSDGKEKVRLWDAAVEKQCQRLLERILVYLRQRVHIWIIRIALEYLSYSRRLEELFGVTRYFLMNFLTLEVWAKGSRLDEKKLALRFLQDEQLAVIQRYRIACAYCLHVHIRQLWIRLSCKEKQWTCGKDEPGPSKENNKFVLIWSSHMDREEKEEVKLPTKYLWTDVLYIAINHNPLVLMLYWENLKKNMLHHEISGLAPCFVMLWCFSIVRNNFTLQRKFKEELIRNNLLLHLTTYVCDIIRLLSLPSHFSELLCFLLSQMDEKQVIRTFESAFNSKSTDRIMECFLDWPHLDEFLPIINQLWGIIPKDKYGQCLLILVSKYNEKDDKENCSYDYRSLLELLWEKTPEEYKQYVFSDSGHNVGRTLLTALLERSPLQNEDEVLFKQIFCYLPQKERRYLINKNSKIGDNICSLLIQKEKLPFVNWLLETCLPNDEIPILKKELIESDGVVRMCIDQLKHNCGNLVEDRIDLCFVSDKTEKDEFKYILRKQCLEAFESLLCVGEFDEVKCLINFCTSWDRTKKQFKSRFERNFNVEEEIRYLKSEVFSRIGINVYYNLVFNRHVYRNLVFNRHQWEVESFYKLFDLSSEDIKKLKKGTLFSPNVLEKIKIACHATKIVEISKEFVACLFFCVTNQDEVIDLKNKVEEEYIKILNETVKDKIKGMLDNFMNKLLSCFRKQNGGLMGMHGEGVLGKEKRSSAVIEDESSALRKRSKSASK